MNRDESAFPHLFQPIKIGNAKSKNRIAMAPTGRAECGPDGSPSDQSICGYVAIARGEVGLIIIQNTRVTRKYGTGTGHAFCFDNDLQMAKWKELADALHRFDVLAVVQLGLGLGRWAAEKHSLEVVAPSAVRGYIPAGSAPRGLKDREESYGPQPRRLTAAEIEELQEDFVAAVQRVEACGFDGVEIHGAHGHLLAQFLSPAVNRRKDKYGGSFERRLTLALNLVRKSRETVKSSKFMVGFRLSGDEHFEDGYTLDDAREIVRSLVEAGLDYVHLSSGCNSALRWFLPPKEGMILDESTGIRAALAGTSVPVICPNIHHPETGEEAFRSGKADMISLSRALLCDPAWVLKAQQGRTKDIIQCTFCNHCFALLGQGFAVRCPRNPMLGYERFVPEYWPIPPAPHPRDGKKRLDLP